ncbi:MAG TPA: DinB family protein [Pyrinomonadaceae bacterium]|nr:DinB family protein [Pyrinomonadaceae bacterium]
MNKNDFERLYAFNRWANEITRNCVAKISVEELNRDLKSSFPSIRSTLEHLIMAEWVWLERIKGTSPTAPFYGETFPDLESLFQKWRQIEENYKNYLAQISDDEILRTIEYKNLAGEANARCVAHILPHVVNHGTYHRGQITAFLRQIGAEAKSTDMIYFQS